ncbi:response regulator transcription factor [uncultured Brevibacillus sp.]|uniref:response regulator transcription factor n=1 Tax=uncultured Brevibacillus sp. TaxID=169970 RepID=UPI00259660DA|nr:helix-turn-helix transcriptional regulator [uncultured Brevibacillus sp.]
MEDRLIQEYVSYYFQFDLLHPQKILHRISTSKALRINDIMSYQEYEQSVYYKQFMQAYGNYDMIGIYLEKGNKLLGGIGLARSKQEKGFTADDARVLGILAKHIANTLAMDARVEEMEDEKILFETHSNMSSIGMIIVESPAFIRYVNPAARDICIELTGGNKWTNPIKAFIEQLLADHSTNRLPTFVTTAHSPTLQKVTIHVQHAFQTQSSYPRNLQYVVYLVPKSKIASRIASHDSNKLALLTPKEWEVYELVQQGYTNQKISGELHISLNTVKRHLQNIYKKMEVTNRTSLCYKINS